MAVTTTPVVTLFAYGVAIDLTGQVLGANVSTIAPLGQFGETAGTVDLNNTDGRFTPGGGGTYSTTDWFAHAIQLDAEVTDGTTTHTVVLGHGIVTGFDISDDGVTSFVRLTFDDGFTVGGASFTSIQFDTTSSVPSLTPISAIDYVYSTAGTSTVISTPAVLPELGHNGYTMFPEGRSKTYNHPTFGPGWEPTDDGWTLDQDVTFRAPAKDFVNTNALPSGPFTAYPTRIRTSTIGSGTVLRYEYTIVGPWTVREDQTATVGSGYRYDFTFHETAGTDRLPFRDTFRRYNSDELTNSVSFTSLPTYLDGVLDVTAENTTSVTAYGSRGRYISQGLSSSPSQTVRTPHTEAQGIANRYANMTADATYHLGRVDTSAKMVEALAPDAVDAWAHLLDIRDGLYQYTAVTYTPTGAGSAQTVPGVIYARTLNLTPTDVTVSLDLYPRGVLAGFILDDAAAGVLDRDLLG